MINVLLLILAVASSGLSLSVVDNSHQNSAEESSVGSVLTEVNTIETTAQAYPLPLQEIKEMFQQEAPNLNSAVVNKVLATLSCANTYNVKRNDILTVIDYSLSSNQKRLWVFDLKAKKMLFNTYVSHGIRSGTLFSKYFSNINNSKASSLGVYRTEKAYYGREGLSLRLEGLENHFNGNAFNRYIVMHGGWYMEEDFIKKYGRAGRSWGCPAVPLALYQAIINTIKENSLFVVYYPSDEWLVQSRFLNCAKNFPTEKLNMLLSEAKPITEEHERREDIVFADLKHNHSLEENDPIVVVSADQYENLYQAKAPLGRMLRRQIDHQEYVALSNSELNRLVANNKSELNKLSFVKPEIIRVNGGYYETQMKLVNLGKIKEIRFNAEPTSHVQQVGSYTVYFESNAV
ncbi:MAG: murein L,D-transpeptidase catalytic domain family protein, partial [Legionella sp.]